MIDQHLLLGKLLVRVLHLLLAEHQQYQGHHDLQVALHLPYQETEREVIVIKVEEIVEQRGWKHHRN